ncbi:winged helix-turn-helix transcriptional regulator [Sutcliffiella horikoshii]|uniref:Helix-turn-helix transcriptional regulator n=1 Tax=Sutcliffiella horikoshii TaxID=79883 RepID=A0A1Y0CTY0_9BACI|nr:helix-turn-helix domain-containing protein [Sutcliffiella horikoshii]ART78376.1 HxlR family transcriptional regulator [Sutcliffiella horikoshii]TYS59691.1 helix-turn-helix transcriptional regulator [Sutcliffiella horikoshii]
MEPTEFPVNRALNVIGGKWRPQVYCALETGPKRFSELEREIPEINRKVLTDQLRELEQLGMVKRTEFPGKVLHVEYELTEEALTLQPTMKSLCKWGTGECEEEQ